MRIGDNHHPRTDLGQGNTDGQGDEAKASVSDEAQVMALVEWLKANDITPQDGDSEAAAVLGMLDATIHNLAWVKGTLARELEAPPTNHARDLVIALVSENREVRHALASAIKRADRGDVPKAKTIDGWRDALSRPWMVPFVARVGIDADGFPYISFADERPEDHA